MDAHNLACIYVMLLLTAVGVHSRRPPAPAPLTVQRMISILTRANGMIRRVKQNLKRNIDSGPTTPATKQLLHEPHYPSDFNEDCKLPIDRGDICDRLRRSMAAPVRYAYVASSGGCRAFRHRGCGGNGNNFASYEQCNRCCYFGCHMQTPADWHPRCAFMAESLWPRSGESCQAKPGGPCPDTHECQNMFSGASRCCPKETEALYRASTSSKCANGLEAFKVPMFTNSDVQTTLLGARCEHDFCPDDTRCEQRQAAAACCPFIPVPLKGRRSRLGRS